MVFSRYKDSIIQLIMDIQGTDSESTREQLSIVSEKWSQLGSEFEELKLQILVSINPRSVTVTLWSEDLCRNNARINYTSYRKQLRNSRLKRTL
jgi:hypothetical protein